MPASRCSRRSDAFSFDVQPDLDRDAVLQVFGCGFVADAANVVLVGGVGTGKTHLAIALEWPAASTTTGCGL